MKLLNLFIAFFLFSLTYSQSFILTADNFKDAANLDNDYTIIEIRISLKKNYSMLLKNLSTLIIIIQNLLPLNQIKIKLL